MAALVSFSRWFAELSIADCAMPSEFNERPHALSVSGTRTEQCNLNHIRQIAEHPGDFVKVRQVVSLPICASTAISPRRPHAGRLHSQL
jgi:hypothetical protein